MPTPPTRFGYTEDQWQACKKEVTEILRQQVALRAFIAYTDLADRIQSIHFDGAFDKGMYYLIGDISQDTNEQDGTMLSVMVVRKEDDTPGDGFFELARSLGRKGDDMLIWRNETRKLGFE